MSRGRLSAAWPGPSTPTSWPRTARRTARRLAAAGQRMLELITDLDALLATRREFCWAAGSATRSAGRPTTPRRRLYEWNARTQITLWGPRDSMLHEYAQKQWSGMMRGFYGPRWQMFLDRLDAALAAEQAAGCGGVREGHSSVGRAMDAPGRPTRSRPSRVGDPVIRVSRRLLEKYGSSMLNATR